MGGKTSCLEISMRAVALLTRKRMAATALFRDPDDRVLLVNPVYKETRAFRSARGA
jgi:hypothetical protein